MFADQAAVGTGPSYVTSSIHLPDFNIEDYNLSEALSLVKKSTNTMLREIGHEDTQVQIVNTSKARDTITCSLKNISIKTILDIISKQSSLTYEITHEGVIFSYEDSDLIE